MTARARGALPDDFPGRSALEAADITTYGAVREAVAANKLTEIDGIGDVTAEKIATALEEADTIAADAQETAPEPEAVPAGNTASTPSDAPVEQETVPAGDANDVVGAGPSDVDRPVSPVRVVCPKCGIGGEVASEDQIGSAVCGSDEHPGTLLVREGSVAA